MGVSRASDRPSVALIFWGLHMGTRVADLMMAFSEKTLQPHPTEKLTLYLMLWNTLSETSALEDSNMASPAAPLS